MRKLAFAVLCVGFLVAADKAKEKKDDPNKKDLDQLQGTWKVTEAQHDGKKLPEKEIEKVKLVIKGNKITVHDGDESKEDSFTIDGSQKLKTIDITQANGKSVKGIFELDGDVLKLCINDSGNRPTEFASKPKKDGNDFRLFTLKREKAEKKKEK